MPNPFSALAAELDRVANHRRIGRVAAVSEAALDLAGLTHQARIGDGVSVATATGPLDGEIVAIAERHVRAMTYGPSDGISVGARVTLERRDGIHPGRHWIGRIVDAFGRPLDGRPLAPGAATSPLRRPPPEPGARRALGARLGTGLAVFDTLLPLARGQRIGIFAGSGIGKSSLLADLARGVEADVVVLGLIGERGREVRHFVEDVLGPDGMARSVVVAATSDQPPLVKRRAAWTAMAVAETFRDEGAHVLLLIDSLTRFAEAHREVALTAGEAPSLRAYPPSTANLIAALCERAGPGAEGMGDITGIFTVLVAGSDMEEPVSDIARGVLDGHVILDRAIAERGRFPAIDVRRSVSRSLPAIASEAENATLATARRVLTTYEDAALMVQTGLYASGTDPSIDRAIRLWPALDGLFAARSPSVPESFAALRRALEEEPRAHGFIGDAGRAR